MRVYVHCNSTKIGRYYGGGGVTEGSETENKSKARITASLEWEHQTMLWIHCHRSGFGNRPSKSNDSSIFSLHFSFSSFFPKNFNTPKMPLSSNYIALSTKPIWCKDLTNKQKCMEHKQQWCARTALLFMGQKIRKSAFIQFHGVHGPKRKGENAPICRSHGLDSMSTVTFSELK